MRRRNIAKVVINTVLTAVLLIGLSSIMLAIDTPSGDDTSITMQAGENTFTYDVVIDNVEKSFASAQFDINMDNISRIEAKSISFKNAIADNASGTIDTISSGGKVDGDQVTYNAGFFSTKNQFDGKLTVGTITFSYAGDAPQSITLNNLQIFRFTGEVSEGGIPELEKVNNTWSKTITVTRKVADPESDLVSGSYGSTKQMTLSSRTSGAAIYYTIDGSEPMRSSTLYSKSITIDKSMTIKAIAVKEDCIDSTVKVFTYTISTNSGIPDDNNSNNPPVTTTPTPTPTPKPTPTPTPTPPAVKPAGAETKFSDVGPGYSWANDAISSLTERGVIMGDGKGNFKPANDIIRADFVVMLSRLTDMGVKGNAKFSDVPAGKYYTDAISKASEAGIILGNGNGNFEPQSSITRQDAFVMVYRYLKLMGKVDDTKASMSSFKDASSLPQYAQQSVSFLVGKGIVKGNNGLLNPSQTITRAETAAILYRIAVMFKL